MRFPPAPLASLAAFSSVPCPKVMKRNKLEREIAEVFLSGQQASPAHVAEWQRQLQHMQDDAARWRQQVQQAQSYGEGVDEDLAASRGPCLEMCRLAEVESESSLSSLAGQLGHLSLQSRTLMLSGVVLTRGGGESEEARAGGTKEERRTETMMELMTETMTEATTEMETQGEGDDAWRALFELPISNTGWDSND